MAKLQLREIPWGCPMDDPDGYCIYTTGRVDPVVFIGAVHSMRGGDVPDDVRAALTVADVQTMRIRRLSPTEARERGLDWGVVKVSEGGYEITAVEV